VTTSLQNRSKTVSKEKKRKESSSAGPYYYHHYLKLMHFTVSSAASLLVTLLTADTLNTKFYEIQQLTKFVVRIEDNTAA
jgi:hypothetical protein